MEGCIPTKGAAATPGNIAVRCRRCLCNSLRSADTPLLLLLFRFAWAAPVPPPSAGGGGDGTVAFNPLAIISAGPHGRAGVGIVEIGSLESTCVTTVITAITGRAAAATVATGTMAAVDDKGRDGGGLCSGGDDTGGGSGHHDGHASGRCLVSAATAVSRRLGRPVCFVRAIPKALGLCNINNK